MKYYHVTESVNVDSILKHGLKPMLSFRSISCDVEEPSIFVYGSLLEAERAIANWFASISRDDELTVIELDVELDIVNTTEHGYSIIEMVAPDRLNVCIRVKTNNYRANWKVADNLMMVVGLGSDPEGSHTRFLQEGSEFMWIRSGTSWESMPIQ